MKNRFLNRLIKCSKIFLIAVLLYGCNEEAVYWDVKSTEQVISQYVESNDEFSDFNGLLESTGLNSLLAVRGPYTLFLPSNTEMQAYYTEKGVGSYLDFSEEFQEQLVLNHIILAQIETGDIGLGAIREVNAIGDFVVSEFDGSDIILNKNTKIIKRDIRASNGFIHLIGRVLDPVTKSVYDVLADNPDYSIFTQGLELVNLKDTLQTITFPFGNKIARARFTILAIADTTFQRFGINNINELVAEFTDAPDSVTYKENGFYRYMEYHCIAETYYLSDLTTQLYPILSYDNNITMTIDTDYKINPDDDDNYTGFYIDESNNPGKNGTIHTINGLLPVFQPEPVRILWETTDHFDLKQGDYYLKTYERWFDGQNTFANIKWEGDYLLYYYKDHDAPTQENWDCLAMSGWWWVEVTTPKIMKGKYIMSGNIWANNIDYAVYVDGVNTALINRTDPANTTSWGEFDWKKTEQHKVKVVATSPGLLFWDTIIFTPSN